MKIAVANSAGASEDSDTRLQTYYAVTDDYDFEANDATDVTDIDTLTLFLDYNRFDYMVFRSALAVYAATVGFANLTSAQKDIVAANLAASLSDCATVHDLQTRIENGNRLHARSIEARTQRVRYASSEVYNRLVKADRDAVITELVSSGLRDLYVEFGRKGTLEGDEEALFDYIEARAGTSHEATGLAQKGYTPIVGTLDDLVARVMDILKNGNY